MKKLLVVNACVRQESRTLSLCGNFLQELKDKYQITRLDLPSMGLAPLTQAQVLERDTAVQDKAFHAPILALAQQFAQADAIVLAAPYWDLSFPALLRVYLEHICTIGVTFGYAAPGKTKTLCKAKSLAWIYTCGGFVQDCQSGMAYLNDLCDLFEIGKRDFIGAEGLDVAGADIAAALAPARAQLSVLAGQY